MTKRYQNWSRCEHCALLCLFRSVPFRVVFRVFLLLQSPRDEAEERTARRKRSISSPLPLAAAEACDTPAALLPGGGIPVSDVREDYDGGVFFVLAPAASRIIDVYISNKQQYDVVIMAVVVIKLFCIERAPFFN